MKTHLTALLALLAAVAALVQAEGAAAQPRLGRGGYERPADQGGFRSGRFRGDEFPGGFRAGGFRAGGYAPPPAFRPYADGPGRPPPAGPPGPYGGRPFTRGQFMPPGFGAGAVVDPRQYHLRRPPAGYGWVTVGPNAYLTQRSTGLILDTAPLY